MDEGIVEKWKNEYMSKDRKYENHVSKFLDYLKLNNKHNRPLSISIDDVIESIGYYNSMQKINTINSMENHLEAIKAFYKYLVSKEYTNDIFSVIHSYPEFKNEIIKKYKLDEVREREVFNIKILKEILDCLEKYFQNNQYNKSSGINSKKGYVKNLVLNLFIKLALIYPTKRNVICDLSINDFEDNFRILKANGLTILVPTNLRKDIINSIDFIKNLSGREITSKDKILNFISIETYKNFRGEDINTWLCDFLKKYEIIDIAAKKDTYSAEVIMNTVIWCMVENMAHPAIISKVSGLSLSTLDKKFYSNKDIKLTNEDQIVNSELIKVGLINYV
ncbi:hypothetical protein [Clostridium beijerinckii]|uniref:hypothetical protein n=1 Tax=Clostridium beijerinckii TaxID=1520 RepID=UPI00232B3D7D|nr:hypothetical protein [Clostridium beijerinckii]